MELSFKRSVSLATTLCLSAIMGLTACTKEVVTEKVIQGEEKKAAEAGADIRVEVNDKMSSEELALAGEQLFGPATFMLAQTALDMSLAKDKTNKRALFYTALLKPFMVYRGIGIRMKPVVRLHGNIAEHERFIAKLPNSPFRDFFLDGKEDIKNIADAQSYLMEMQKAWNETRLFLLNNSNLNLTLNLNPHIFKQEIENEITESCHLTRVDDSQNFEASCNYRGAAQRKVNAADIIALRQSVAGMVMMYNFYTSYSVEDIDQLMVLDREGKMTSEQRLRYIEDNLPEVGKLRKDNQLKQIIDLGSDMVAAANWAIKFQSQLCPKGPNEVRQRPGFLFSQGICVENIDKAKKDVVILEQILKGAIDTKVSVPGENRDETTKVDYLAWARNPIQDLRQIAPLTYNRCGEAASLKDKTYGGLFPQGDAEKFMLSPCNK